LYAYTFTLHFYPDESAQMDNTQINYTSYPSSCHFKLDPSLPWTFNGSDLLSSDSTLSFSAGANGDLSISVLMNTLNEPNGNPGICTHKFSLVP